MVLSDWDPSGEIANWLAAETIDEVAKEQNDARMNGAKKELWWRACRCMRWLRVGVSCLVGLSDGGGGGGKGKWG